VNCLIKASSEPDEAIREVGRSSDSGDDRRSAIRNLDDGVVLHA
jgi:hypothetical protein